MTSRNQQFRDEIVDDSARRPVIATSGNGWVTILGLLASIGVFAKAFLVSDGIIWDEQPTFDNHACGGVGAADLIVHRQHDVGKSG